MSPTRTLRNRIIPRLPLVAAASAAALAVLVSSGVTAARPARPARPAAALAAARPPGSAAPSPTAVATPAIAAPATVAPATVAGTGSGAAIVLTAASATPHRLTPRQIAEAMLRRFHWQPRRQFRYLSWLWQRESGWNLYASNPYSGAYGIPQALPGSKMASAGPDWRSNAATQIRWGLRYIRGRYGTPQGAWRHEVAYGWY